jgi:hypothetical protein
MNLFTAKGRELSFADNWSLDGKLSTRNMAEAGFYRSMYDGDNDRVICVYCDWKFWDWNEGHIPTHHHMATNPTCRFIRRFPEGTNVLSELVDVFPDWRSEQCDCDAHLMSPSNRFFQEAELHSKCK